MAPRPLPATGVDLETLNYIGEEFSTPPEDLTLHTGIFNIVIFHLCMSTILFTVTLLQYPVVSLLHRN